MRFAANSPRSASDLINFSRPLVPRSFRTLWFLIVGLSLFGSLNAQERSTWDIQWGWDRAEVERAGGGFWPQYRGAHGDGHAAEASDPPVEWGEDKNLAWKKEMAGRAWSSPVVYGDRIFLTNASEDGLTMSAVCVERASGKTVWERVVFTNTETQKDFHAFNSYASPTPIVDARYLYVTLAHMEQLAWMLSRAIRLETARLRMQSLSRGGLITNFFQRPVGISHGWL